MIDDEELEQRTYQLLNEAAHVYRSVPPAAALLRATLDRLADPLRLAVAGPPRSGKSTLVNALIGEELAPVEVPGEQPGTVAYRDATEPRAWWHDAEIPVVRTANGLRLTPDARHAGRPGGAHRAVIEWPSRVLRRTELIDTRLPLPQAVREADAILYVTPQLGEAELQTLQTTIDVRGQLASPVNVMVVLSRADATGGGRADALLAAKQAARRRRREPRTGALCQDLVAVSPLIAATARTLGADEFQVIAALAALPRAESEPHLLSTDRFTAAGALHPVDAQRRVRLLQRLGLGGIRLALTLTRTGCDTAAVLAERLQEHSGLKDLQSSIAGLFTARRAVLRARSALATLDHLLRTRRVPPAARLLADLELLVAEAHDLRELRLLAALRSGRVNLPREHAADARQLLGGSGTSVGERLGMSPDATADETWSAARAAAGRWQELAHGRTLPPAQRRAAEVVLRSCDLIAGRLDRLPA
ncbi:P-loop NTPase family protein [Actinoplanes siamensis]|uniref:Isoniazid-inducible protein iniC n=1 Tax=Actinoplanes siamensis TaxID=1223317 RepID=A0A919N6S7_9ACTN|nr:hypothetical protein [Actinoplanes siamensis]GIF05457.1 isoniazid-inducible protein iniC [Actinoplanes siamensis]